MNYPVSTELKFSQRIGVQASGSRAYSTPLPAFHHQALGAAADKIYFGAARDVATDKLIDAKLGAYARKLLNEVNGGQPLQPGQKLGIQGQSKYLPLIYKLVELAYGPEFLSGAVSIKKDEPKLDALRKRFNTAQFNSDKLAAAEMKEDGVAFIRLEGRPSAYKAAGLTEKEARKAAASISPRILPETRKALDINPDEILFDCLGLAPGQPLQLAGQREHLPQLLKLAQRAFENGTTLLRLNLTENKKLDPKIPFYRYASEDVLKDVPPSVVEENRESVDRNVARLTLSGGDPEQYKGLDATRMQMNTAALGKAKKPWRNQLINSVPWVIYYLPSRASASAAGYPNLKRAALEGQQIVRRGKLGEHIRTLRVQTDKLNSLLAKGYRTIHFVSCDPVTGKPDGKTDLRVGLTDKSEFASAQMKTTRGQVCMANVPSEESFTTPDNTKAHGVVTATLPLSLSGNLIKNLRVEFENGRIARGADGQLKISGENADVFRQMIEQNQALEQNDNAGRLGEVALVADSPIYKLGKIFKNTLLDENATCHIAVGNGYSECVKGANDITDPAAQEAFLKSVNCNISAVHTDFMIGGPHVKVFAEKPDGSDEVIVIENNQFMI